MIQTKINMIPGIDWTKETLVLISTSGVEHCAVSTEKRTPNYVKVDQHWGGGGYSIVNCGDYLSVKFYHIKGNFSRVSDFKRNVATGDHIGLIPASSYYKYSYSNVSILDADTELRIYKDRKIVLLHKIVAGGKTLYYVDADPENWWKVKTWDKNMNWSDEETIILLENKNIHIMNNDKEIKTLAHRITKKEHNKIHNSLYNDGWSDLNSRHIRYYNSCECGSFTEETRKLVHDFFEYSKKENGCLRSHFEKERGNHIDSLEDLFTWCYLKDKPSTQAATKEEQANSLLTNGGLLDEWNNPNSKTQQREAIWSRYKDDIILIQPQIEGCGYGWGYGHKCKKIFAYNVKTKKRFYGEQDRNGTWTFPIPGLKYVTTSLHLGVFETYDFNQPYESRQQEVHTETIIKNGLTARQLFDGTNIAWILDNTVGECKILNTDDYKHYYRPENEILKPVDVREYLSDTKIGTIALSILITTGIPMLEQLLKSKLFNMYFTAIEDLENRSSSSYETFYDEDKKRTASSESNRQMASFVYHSKEKNLKKMFGLSLNSLREINNLMVFSYNTHGNEYSKEYWARPVPTVTGMAEALNTDLSTLDSTTFGRCLALAIPNVRHSHNRFYNHNGAWAIVGDTVAKAIGAKATPKQILSLLESYVDCLEEYKDYLSMRTQLKHIQEVKPDIPDIYSEKHYPVKPGAAKRFLPFLHGMPDTAHPWRRTTFTEESFIENYTSIYNEAAERGELQIVKEDGHLLGLLVTFTPAENLKYLHDEASYWISFYQDSAKEELFHEAVKRVKPLEWTDDKSGLCILAPTGIQDIKNEGSVLSHCVASYIDPIIHGTENIMFLRRTDMVNSPFYTVEVLGDGEIRQVHCYRNGDLTSMGQRRAYNDSQYEVYDHDYDIVKFLLEWAKAKKGKVKASSIKSAYGALCALR